MVAFRILSRFAGYRYWANHLGMYVIPMTAFAASINKAGAFKLYDEFPYLGWHTIIVILIYDRLLCPRSLILSRLVAQLRISITLNSDKFEVRFKRFDGNL